MDSTAEYARDAKRARLTTAPDSGGADLISGLDDDVLLRVLGSVGDARDAARTAALSRRWRGLWTCVPALRFAYRPPSREASGAEWRASLQRHVSFVNDVLVRRSTRTQSGDRAAAVESLVISCARAREQEQLMPPPAFVSDGHDMEQLMLVSAGAAQWWIRHAFHHGIKSLVLDMHLPSCPMLIGGSNHHEKYPKKQVILLDELPSPVRLETMRLSLAGAGLRLPTAVKFSSLEDLSLERIAIADDDGARLLARLVSSPICPRLKKLRMRKLWFHPDCSQGMRIESDVLSELWVEDMIIMSLELRTPSLRVLHVEECYPVVLSLSAPRLKEVALLFGQGGPPRLLQVDGDLPCVVSLRLYMWAHRHRTSHYGEHNESYIPLLKSCSSLTSLEVTLVGTKASEKHVDMIKGKVPHLPQITSLTVNVSSVVERHDFWASVANLLARFTNLRHLHLHLPLFDTSYYDLDEDEGLEPEECDHPDHWASHEISMAGLQEVEFSGLTGTNCELWFMKAVLASAKRLGKVTISFSTECSQHEGRMDAFERMLLDEGMQTSCRGSHMLTCLLSN